VLQLAARVEGERIVEVRFKASGCVTAIACGSALCEMLQGMTLAEAAAIRAEKVAEHLGGLPPATVHGSQLAADALEGLLEKLPR
jgi:nitrogen fixation NifU-like protein